MKVLWADSAAQNRRDIVEYIALDDLWAAIQIDALFERAVERLSEHPKLGRVGMLAGTRELIPHRSYRLIYEISEDQIWILALLHTARQWPPE